jgi:hypothetical protein
VAAISVVWKFYFEFGFIVGIWREVINFWRVFVGIADVDWWEYRGIPCGHRVWILGRSSDVFIWTAGRRWCG